MAMDDLISRKRLLRDIYFQEGRYPETPLMRMAVREQPAIDAAPVVHAHWDEWWPGDCSLIMTGEEMLYQCSACTAKFSDVDGFRYCPHCGALMEGINHVESDDQA